MGSWLNDLKAQSNPDVKIFLIGNKCDLEESRTVQKSVGEKYSKDNQLDTFMETSARTGTNTRNVLVEAAKVLYKDYLLRKDLPKPTPTAVKLDDKSKTNKQTEAQNQKKCCKN